MEFLETSAKSGLNIKSLFNRVVAQLGLQQPAQTNPDGTHNKFLIAIWLIRLIIIVIDVNLENKEGAADGTKPGCRC